MTTSPKLRSQYRHAKGFLELFGSIGRYRDQSIETWHGFYNQRAAKHSTGTDEDGCAIIVRAMAVARDAVDSNLFLIARRPTKAGARKAVKKVYRRLRANKGGFIENQSSLKTIVKEGRL